MKIFNGLFIVKTFLLNQLSEAAHMAKERVERGWWAPAESAVGPLFEKTICRITEPKSEKNLTTPFIPEPCAHKQSRTRHVFWLRVLAWWPGLYPHAIRWSEKAKKIAKNWRSNRHRFSIRLKLVRPTTA